MEQQGLGILLGLGSLAVGYVFSKIGEWGGKEVDRLKNVPRYYNYSKLRDDLSASPTGVLSQVMLQGTARRPSNSPSLYSEEAGIEGAARLVITTTTARVYNETNGKWEEKNTNLTNLCLSVPFTLTDSDGKGVTVENIHMSSGFRSVLQLVYQTKRDTEQRSIGDYATNMTLSEIPVGSKTKEYMLLYGSMLAGIGDAMHLGGGRGDSIVFYPDQVGKSIRSLIYEKEMIVQFSKFASTVLLVGGVSMIFIAIILPWIKERLQREREREQH